MGQNGNPDDLQLWLLTALIACYASYCPVLRRRCFRGGTLWEKTMIDSNRRLDDGFLQAIRSEHTGHDGGKQH